MIGVIEDGICIVCFFCCLLYFMGIGIVWSVWCWRMIVLGLCRGGSIYMSCFSVLWIGLGVSGLYCGVVF